MKRIILFVGLVAAVLTNCSPDRGNNKETFVVASTTSTQDSGLLDELTPAFERANPGLKAKIVAVGSGEAMELGRRGDADVLLVHSPKDEERFMQEGLGTSRTAVMSNNFVIAGPGHDPAGVRGSRGAVGAFAKIAASRSLFVSRGDQSGTHKRELDLWDKAKVTPKDYWYLSSGQGMAETLTIASEKRAYVLTDTATYKVVRSRSGLTSLFLGDALLINPYSVIAVKGSLKPKAAEAFANWISGVHGQEFIGRFGKERYGSPLFKPARPFERDRAE